MSQQNPTLFLGIGAQKSGTSWLGNYFKTHPEIFMSPIKEMNFWGNRNTLYPKRFIRLRDEEKAQKALGLKYSEERLHLLNERIAMRGDLDKYKAFFAAQIKTESVYGEITPRYSFMSHSEMALIKSEFPTCKILFMMRNPASRSWSQMRFSHNKGSAKSRLVTPQKRLSKPAYAKRSDYRQTIENIESVFDPEQIHYVFFENLFNQTTVNGICDFLEISHRPASLNVKRNEAARYAVPIELRKDMIAHLRPQYDFVIDKFGAAVPENWRRDLEL